MMPEESFSMQQAQQEAELLLSDLQNFRPTPTAQLRSLLDRLDTVFVQENLLNMVRLQPLDSTDAGHAGAAYKNHFVNYHLWRRLRSHGYNLMKEFSMAAEQVFPSVGDITKAPKGLRRDFDEVRQLCLIYPEGVCEPGYNGKLLDYSSLSDFYNKLIGLIPVDIAVVLQVKTRQIADRLRSANLHPRLRLVINSELQGIWLRDYAGFNMGTHLVKPNYEPGVYWGNKAVARHIGDNMKLLHSLLDLDLELLKLVWDGGNMVTNGEYAFISEQLILDNAKKYSQPEIEILIQQKLGVTAIWVLLPKTDKLAHTDGYLTFVSPTKALVSTYPPHWAGSEEQHCVTTLARQVEALGLEVERVMEYPVETQTKTDIDSAVGLHVNLLQLNETWLVPTYNLPSDEETLLQLQRLRPDGNIVAIDCTELAKLGGVLHCISFCN